MRNIRHGLSLALVCCAVVFGHTTAAVSQSSSDNATQGSKTLLPCAPANLKKGYSQNIKFPKSDSSKSGRKVPVYDTDYDEPQKHDPICLSKQNDDAILWLSSSGKKFKLKIRPHDDAGHCGQHPFKFEPTEDSVDGYYSGPLRSDVPVGCVYDVEFHREDGKSADPHIQVR